ncbi:CMTM4 [Branchiostoma lanceolatum]|uniref:CMTM4 protein n=1 Tax=Branchiostoma lanceolatum TaxID=7740 RepID=A0A8K0A5K0_BRALA|nr:CMTM4 [Branchiostoma lanceolatum]
MQIQAAGAPLAPLYTTECGWHGRTTKPPADDVPNFRRIFLPIQAATTPWTYRKASTTSSVIDREDNRRSRWIQEVVWIRKTTPDEQNRDEGDTSSATFGMVFSPQKRHLHRLLIAARSSIPVRSSEEVGAPWRGRAMSQNVGVGTGYREGTASYSTVTTEADQESPYSPTTTTLTTTQSGWGLTCDLRYCRTFPGITKIVQMPSRGSDRPPAYGRRAILPAILALVAFIIAEAASCSYGCGRGAFSFFEFVTVTSFLVVLVIFLCMVTTAYQKVTIVHWPLTELITCIVCVLAYLIASSVLAANVNDGAGGGAVGFGFLSLLAFVAGGYFAFREWQDEARPHLPVNRRGNYVPAEENEENEDL